jgi:hypothetical protein
MKKLNFHPSFLQIVYLIIYIILFSFIIYIPKLITGPVHITEKMIFEEEIIEASLLGIMFILNILIFNLYRNEAFRQKELIKKISNDKKTVEERLEDSFKYIGQINVQIQEIKSIFNDTDKFPETKNDLKKAYLFFSKRVFGIVNTNWVLFRIINCITQKTINEQFETRQGLTIDYPHISNKMIVEKQSCLPFTTIISNPPNLNILCCCILHDVKISNDERVFIQAITNEITMMFVILNSSYSKKGVT